MKISPLLLHFWSYIVIKATQYAIKNVSIGHLAALAPETASRKFFGGRVKS